MIVMAFETASPSGGVALLRDGLVEGEMRVNNSQSHSRLALAFAGELLEGLRLDWKSIDLFAASHGPGSFTGIRVGLTAVKSLAWSLGKKCVTVSSLEALAAGVSHGLHPGQRIVPLLDARLGEVYCGIYRVVEDGMLVAEGEEFAVRPEELVARVPPGAIYCGEGAVRYFSKHFANHGTLARTDHLRSSPATTGWLAWKHAMAGNMTSPGDIRAVYLREAATTKPVG